MPIILRLAQAQAVIPKEVYYSLHQILDRLWEDEKEDYESRSPADQDGHLFEALACVGGWLTSVRHDNSVMM